MKSVKAATLLLAFLAMLFFFSSSLGETGSSETTVQTAHDSNDPTVITVAPFPYIPNHDTFERITVELWQEIEPNVRLEFVEWDCFKGAPSGADVLMYDAVFTTWLAQNGHLRSIELSDIDCLDGLFSFSLDAIFNRGKVWGIPYMLCADSLIYLKDDEEIRNADTVTEIFEIIGPRKTDSMVPPDRTEGALVDFVNNAACYYAQSVVDNLRDPGQLKEMHYLQDPSSLYIMSLLRDMTGPEMAFPEPNEENILPTHPIAQWFEEGHGRVLFGYSEASSQMESIIDQVDVKFVSFSSNEDTPMFYADIVSISSSVKDKEKFELCKKLLNVISGEEFVLRLVMNDSSDPTYMLPALEPLWLKLKDEYSIYQSLYPYMTDEENRIIRFGDGVYDYLDAAFTHLMDYIEAYEQ